MFARPLAATVYSDLGVVTFDRRSSLRRCQVDLVDSGVQDSEHRNNDKDAKPECDLDGAVADQLTQRA